MDEKTELERFITAEETEEGKEETETSADTAAEPETAAEGDAPPEESSADPGEEIGDPEEEIAGTEEETAEPFAESETDESVSGAPEIPVPEEISLRNGRGGAEKRPGAAAVGIGIANTVIAVLTLCAVAAGFCLFSDDLRAFREETSGLQEKIRSLEEEKKLLESDYIEAMSIIEETEPEDGTAPIGIEAESGKILIYDSSVGYAWIPVLSELAQHSYRKSNFSVDERGRMYYTERGEDSSYFGIDVSSHQGDIDWQLVKEDGVEFAFLRIGYRGYGEEGRLCLDEKFLKNYEEAHDAGIDLGIYFFSQAVTAEEAAEEASFLLAALDGRTLEYPIVFDWETVVTASEDAPPRTEDVMPQTLTLSAVTFCEAVEDAGYRAMIYTNKKQAVMKYDLRKLSAYPVWLAYYDTDLNYCYDFDIWQYGTGSVDGIEGEVDLNIAMIR